LIGLPTWSLEYTELESLLDDDDNEKEEEEEEEERLPNLPLRF